MDNNAKPTWKAVGRYGYWAVDEYRDDEPGNAVYGTVDTYTTKKAAEKVANALNAAYKRGQKAGMTKAFQAVLKD